MAPRMGHARGRGLGSEMALAVGDLARRSGLSVRALHHYEEIGLLIASARTAAGHRRYASADVARLHQIVSLRRLGFGLAEIRGLLDSQGTDPLDVVEAHLARVRAQILLQERLCGHLEGLARMLRAKEEIGIDDLLATLEAMAMVEKHYTPEQLDHLAARRREIGKERIARVEAEWISLMAEVAAAIDGGVDPANARAQALAERWMGLVREFSGGDPALERAARAVQEEAAGQETPHPGYDPRMPEYMAYVQQALSAANRYELRAPRYEVREHGPTTRSS